MMMKIDRITLLILLPNSRPRYKQGWFPSVINEIFIPINMHFKRSSRRFSFLPKYNGLCPVQFCSSVPTFGVSLFLLSSSTVLGQYCRSYFGKFYGQFASINNNGENCVTKDHQSPLHTHK